MRDEGTTITEPLGRFPMAVVMPRSSPKLINEHPENDVAVNSAGAQLRFQLLRIY